MKGGKKVFPLKAYFVLQRLYVFFFFFGLTEKLESIIYILKRKAERLINLAKVTELETMECQIQSVSFSKVPTLSARMHCLI